MNSKFEALINDLGAATEMAKSFEEKGAAAAAADEGNKDDAEIAAAAEGEGEKGDEDETVAKSFTVTMADGTTVEAVDGSEMIKSLIARVEDSDAALLATGGAVTALTDMVKSLAGQVEALQNTGVRRKAVLAITEKPAPVADVLAKSDAPAGVTGEVFMAKALEANAAGRITSVQVAYCENLINAGQTPPAELVRAVLTA